MSMQKFSRENQEWVEQKVAHILHNASNIDVLPDDAQEELIVYGIALFSEELANDPARALAMSDLEWCNRIQFNHEMNPDKFKGKEGLGEGSARARQTMEKIIDLRRLAEEEAKLEWEKEVQPSGAFSSFAGGLASSSMFDVQPLFRFAFERTPYEAGTYYLHVISRIDKQLPVQRDDVEEILEASEERFRYVGGTQWKIHSLEAAAIIASYFGIEGHKLVPGDQIPNCSEELQLSEEEFEKIQSEYQHAIEESEKEPGPDAQEVPLTNPGSLISRVADAAKKSPDEEAPDEAMQDLLGKLKESLAGRGIEVGEEDLQKLIELQKPKEYEVDEELVESIKLLENALGGVSDGGMHSSIEAQEHKAKLRSGYNLVLKTLQRYCPQHQYARERDPLRVLAKFIACQDSAYDLVEFIMARNSVFNKEDQPCHRCTDCDCD